MRVEECEGQVSADACASYTKYGDDIALRRMENAGAIITTMDQIVSGWRSTGPVRTARSSRGFSHTTNDKK